MSDDRRSEPAGEIRSVDQLLTLCRVGQTLLARRLAQDRIGRDPHDAGGYVVLAVTFLASNVPNQGLAAIETALRLEPENPTTWRVRSMLLRTVGRWRESEEASVRAIALDPDDATAHGEYARTLALLEQNDAALASVEAALALDSSDADYLGLRAAILLSVPSRRWTQSEASARAALRIDPLNVDNEAILACVLMRLGRHDEAESCLRRALSREPNHELAFRALSELTVTRHPIYRPMLAYNRLMQRLNPGQRMAFLVGFWALGRSVTLGLEALGRPSEASLFSLAYLALCIYTWFAQPVSRWLMGITYPWLRSSG